MMCSIAGCARTAQARGWCSSHYARWRHYGDPMVNRRPGNSAWSIGDITYIDVSTKRYPQAVAVVETADLDLIFQNSNRWAAHRLGKRLLYVSQNRPGGGHTLLHRLVLGLKDHDGWLVDHANRDTLDNRRSNLRIATKTQNNANALARCDAGFKGVRAKPGGRYEARIGIAGGDRYLGRFESPEAAALAYDTAARDAFGEFALLNFPAEVAA